jgi:7,8-dihydropterin-6-yl-methyl-4-(beta-D-ribofuranosyl)aminobenzene 5'-phosphate synthase
MVTPRNARKSVVAIASLLLTMTPVFTMMAPRCLAQSTASASGPDAHPQVHALKITILSTMLADDGIGEWGFAALVEADGRKILFDTGARPNTVLENARELKVDLSGVQDVILSHFHDDHTSGLMTLRREFAKSNPAAFSRVHVAKGIFLERRGQTTNPMIQIKKDYEATGGVFVVHEKPEEIFPGIWLTGPVPRAYPENNYPAGVEVNTGSEWIEDNVPDDQSLVFNTAHGLVLLSGCGHSGIVNTLQYARGFLRPAPVDAAIGGFHLYAANDQQLAWTASKLKEYQTESIMGAHCTGIESVYRLRELLGLTRQTCLVGTVGAVYDLNAGIKTGRIAQ